MSSEIESSCVLVWNCFQIVNQDIDKFVFIGILAGVPPPEILNMPLIS